MNEQDSASAREESELVAACFPPLFVLRVGREAARKIREGGLSLEEYCAEG